MKELPGIEDLHLQNQKVIVRVDFNVPLDANNGEISDTGRIEKTLPTIQHLLKKRCAIILISHLGRPKGVFREDLSLKKVAEKLQQFLPENKVTFAPHGAISQYHSAASKLQAGEILLLDNIRFFAEETSAKESERKKLASDLAKMGEVYINDAFGASHRAHASVAEIAKLLPSYAGLLLKKEIVTLTNVLKNPMRPFLAIIGGSKVSSKLKVLENLIPKVDNILIGGAMGYTFLKSRGLRVGASMVENEILSQASQIIDKARYNECGFFLPEDHIISSEFADTKNHKTSALEIPEGWMGMDIGPKTIKKYEKIIADAKTILWNGPMGVFEMENFNKGTMAIARAMAKISGTKIVGGGDSMAAVKISGVEDKMSHISTGGGATLEFLEGKTLPGVEVLYKESEDDES